MLDAIQLDQKYKRRQIYSLKLSLIFKKAVKSSKSGYSCLFVFALGSEHLNFVLREADSGLNSMYGIVVTRQSARLCERAIAQRALEGPDIVVTPVVDDEAGALGEHLVAVVELADKVRDDLLEVLVEHLYFAV